VYVRKGEREYEQRSKGDPGKSRDKMEVNKKWRERFLDHILPFLSLLAAMFFYSAVLLALTAACGAAPLVTRK
jgi:hypothetical protein